MDPSEPVGKEAEELVQEGQLVCRLTNQHFTATDAEETLQNFIEQFHREYRIEFEDMVRFPDRLRVHRCQDESRQDTIPHRFSGRVRGGEAARSQ